MLTRRLVLLPLALLLVMIVAVLDLRGVAQGDTFTVDKAVDATDANPGDGVCDDGTGDCTLRAAIMEANASPGPDTINVPPNTYTLTLDSELTIDEPLKLTGAGADSTIIQAATEPGGVGFPIFNIIATDVTMSGVTIQYGSSGIVNIGATITLTDSAVSDNTGRGIDHYAGELTIINSTISGNTDSGISTGRSVLTVINSTINANAGSGIFIGNSPIFVVNSTISSNAGGGIFNAGGTAKLHSTILANNLSSKECDVGDLGGFFSDGYNLVGDDSCGFSGPGDIVGVDPKLGPLQDNGGLTFTHALVPGSPAIDAGDDAACLATDQRGVTRPQGTACDIGAYELAICPPSQG
jgi:CSLREA domain-containing protein